MSINRFSHAAGHRMPYAYGAGHKPGTPYDRGKGRDTIVIQSPEKTGKPEKHEKLKSSFEGFGSSGKTSWEDHPTFSKREKVEIAENINILHERNCQLISTQTYLVSKHYELKEERKKPNVDEVKLNKKIAEIDEALNNIHLEGIRITKLTKKILTPGTTYSKTDEIDEFSDLVKGDSRVEELFNRDFKQTVGKIKNAINNALRTGDETELNKQEIKLVELYQKKIEENKAKLEILYERPFDDMKISIETTKKIETMESENTNFKKLSEELSDKISLRESFFSNLHEVEVLQKKLDHLNHTIDHYEKEFPKSDEINVLSRRRDSTKNKLEFKLGIAKKSFKNLKESLKINPSANPKELENLKKNYEKLVNISKNLIENDEKQIKKSENILQLKSLEKKIAKITDDFSEKIKGLTENWESKSKREKEESLKQINHEYITYSNLWDSKKEIVVNIENLCIKTELVSHELLKHEALKATITKLNEHFKIDGKVDNNLFYILKNIAANSAILSTSVLQKIKNMTKIVGVLAVAGIALSVYMYNKFNQDKNNFNEEKQNKNDYKELLNEVDILMKYRKTTNEALKGDVIHLSDNQISEYSNTVKEFEKIKARVKHLEDFFITPSLKLKIGIGDKLAHSINEQFPNALIERDENANYELGKVELLRNPWASKKAVENFKESDRIILHNAVDGILADCGLVIDGVADMMLPEEVNFRKAYSAHVGVAAEMRLIDSELKYDTKVLNDVKASLLEGIREFEETTKSVDENRILASWRGHTSEYDAMKRGQEEQSKNSIENRENKARKEARKREISKSHSEKKEI